MSSQPSHFYDAGPSLFLTSVFKRISITLKSPLEEKGRKQEEHYLVFEAGGYPLAARLSQIQKVYAQGETAPEEKAMDLGEIIGSKQKTGRYYLEVLAKGKTVPVLVDRIEPIKDLQLAVWLDFPGPMRRPGNKMIRGFFFDGSRMISLIDFMQVFPARGK